MIRFDSSTVAGLETETFTNFHLGGVPSVPVSLVDEKASIPKIGFRSHN